MTFVAPEKLERSFRVKAINKGKLKFTIWLKHVGEPD